MTAPDPSGGVRCGTSSISSVLAAWISISGFQVRCDPGFCREGLKRPTPVESRPAQVSASPHPNDGLRLSQLSGLLLSNSI